MNTDKHRQTRTKSSFAKASEDKGKNPASRKASPGQVNEDWFGGTGMQPRR